MNEWMIEWVSEWMDGWIDGWTSCLYVRYFSIIRLWLKVGSIITLTFLLAKAPSLISVFTDVLMKASSSSFPGGRLECCCGKCSLLVRRLTPSHYSTRNTTIAVPLVEKWFTCIWYLIDIFPFNYSACPINTTIVQFSLTSNITLNAIWYWFNPKIIP